MSIFQKPANEVLSDAETNRLRQMSNDTDDELQLNFERLLELASNAPEAIVHIAQQRAPEAAARVAKMTGSGT